MESRTAGISALESIFESELESQGVIILSGDVTHDSAKEIVEALLKIDANPDLKAATLIINSYGGDLHSAFFITDIMSIVSKPVHTLGTGAVMSAGLMIAMAGKHGRRFLTPYSMILSHRFWDGKIGSHADLVAARRGEDIAHELCLTHFLRHTKYRTEKQVEKNLLKKVDEWMTPGEALLHGLADHIIDDWTEATA